MSSKTYKDNVLTYKAEDKMPRMPQSRLPELIEEARKSGLTFRDIQRRSGGRLHLASLNAWHKGKTPNPNLTVETIMDLAKGLGRPPSVVFEYVIGKVSPALGDESMEQLLEDFARLSTRDRQNPRIVVLMDMLNTEIQKLLDRDA